MYVHVSAQINSSYVGQYLILDSVPLCRTVVASSTCILPMTCAVLHHVPSCSSCSVFPVSCFLCSCVPVFLCCCVVVVCVSLVSEHSVSGSNVDHSDGAGVSASTTSTRCILEWILLWTEEQMESEQENKAHTMHQGAHRRTAAAPRHSRIPAHVM